MNVVWTAIYRRVIGLKRPIPPPPTSCLAKICENVGRVHVNSRGLACHTSALDEPWAT